MRECMERATPGGSPIRVLPGQYYDVETGNHYNYFRDYDPKVGRYAESDPIGLRGGLDTYGYVYGSPLTHVDPLGLATVPFPGPFPGTPGSREVICAMNPLIDGCRVPEPSKLKCKLRCNIKYQSICTATGLFVGSGGTPIAGGFAAGGCVLLKGVICDEVCDKNPTCA